MEVNIKTLLHPRIDKHCETLFDDGHYKHVASEAMIQVELALKEQSGEKKKFGVNLTKSLFGVGRGIKLRDWCQSLNCELIFSNWLFTFLSLLKLLTAPYRLDLRFCFDKLRGMHSFLRLNSPCSALTDFAKK